MFKKKPAASKPAAAGAAADEAKQKLQAEPGAEATARLNNNNSGMLSDAGIFAYCSLTATALAQLYPEDWHKEFREKFLADVLHKRPDSIRNSATAILRHGQADCSMLPFAEALLTEESVRACPEMVLQDLLLVALREGCYDARARYLLKHVAFAMRISWASLEEWELKTAALLNDPASEAEVVDEAMKRNRRRKVNRAFLIGASAVGGGLLIGLTGGLAAPLVAAGAGVIIGGAGAAAIGTAAGAAVLGSVFGVAGAGLTGWKMRKRVGSLAQFQFVQLTPPPTPQLHLCIAVSGWIDQGDLDFLLPWQSLAMSPEQYALCWESRYLKEMGQALDYFMSYLKSFAIQPRYCPPPTAVEGGKVLADVLLSREYGQRPVTLIGFSMGAKLIFSCLQELASRKKGVEGIIEDVYLLGAPVSGSAKDWSPFARVVSGKIVNCYCRTDWFLKFMYRTMSASFSLAGLGPVQWSDRRMCNLDLTSMIGGHKDYFKKMSEILPIIGVPTTDKPKPVLSRLPTTSAPQLGIRPPVDVLAPAAAVVPGSRPTAEDAGAAAPAKSDSRARSASLSRLDEARRRLLAEEAGGVPVAAAAPSAAPATSAEVASSNPATRIGAVKAVV
uniref:Transmembrane and coiled-coil domain-containing protein 4 n=1 Tax=Macrostomum lignano TaxID=282301 RepID=A0A1I8IF43_9PLAT